MFCITGNGSGQSTSHRSSSSVRKSARMKPSKYRNQAGKNLSAKGKNRRMIYKKNVSDVMKDLGSFVRISVSVFYHVLSLWLLMSYRVIFYNLLYRCKIVLGRTCCTMHTSTHLDPCLFATTVPLLIDCEISRPQLNK